MNSDKVNHVIDMIKDMDLENKLRLAICMCDNCSYTNLEYDKKEIYKHFDKMLKEIRNKGFGVSVVDLKKTNDLEKKDMLIIQLNKKKLKELTHIIRSNDPDAFVVINETKYVQNGLIK